MVATATTSVADKTTSLKRRRNTTHIFFFKDTGGLSPLSVALLLVAPLLWSGQYHWCFGVLVVGLFWAVKLAMEQLMDNSDKVGIRYNVLSPQDVMAELERLEEDEPTTTTATTTCAEVEAIKG